MVWHQTNSIPSTPTPTAPVRSPFPPPTAGGAPPGRSHAGPPPPSGLHGPSPYPGSLPLRLLHPVAPSNPRPVSAVASRPGCPAAHSGAACGTAAEAAGRHAVSRELRVLGGGGDAEAPPAQAQVDEGDDPRRRQVRRHQGQAAGSEAAHRLRGGAVPQPRGVLVRRRDRHCHGHNHDPGGHLHARLQVRDPSMFVLRPVLVVADNYLERLLVDNPLRKITA
jgi:hypothetical protein